MAIALSLAYTVTPLAAGVKAVVYATAQISPGKNFVPPSAYKYIFTSAAAAASPANVLATYTALFGALVSGQKIFFRIVPFSATGFRGDPIEASVVVT